ncbi:MAG: CoA-binding protein [Rhodobacteraceae bacterium]|nr:CoA-binding protein [Paracoccaceae bacterium]
MNYSDTYLRTILTESKTIAAVGVSTNSIRPSYFVARYLNLKKYRVLPVNPVYEGQMLFGEEIYPTMAALPRDLTVDMVDVFRRPDQVLPVVEEAIEHLLPRGLKTIWMQIGVVNEEAAALAESAGLKVVMNRCPKIEHQRLFGELRMGGFNTGIISSKL